jgi:hypothetical protein
MTSLISAIRAAVRPGAIPDSLDENEPGALASTTELPLPEAQTTGGDMSNIQTAPGVAAAAAGTLAAVAAAASGGADGFKTAMDRMNAVLSADGIKGDAKRMSAALELANASSGMDAEAVIAFVTANVPATKAEASAPAAPAASAQTYEQQRTAAANLAMPSGTASATETVGASWKDAIAKAGVGRKGA